MVISNKHFPLVPPTRYAAGDHLAPTLEPNPTAIGVPLWAGSFHRLRVLRQSRHAAPLLPARSSSRGRDRGIAQPHAHKLPGNTTSQITRVGGTH
jgi:hypothetical protein